MTTIILTPALLAAFKSTTLPKSVTNPLDRDGDGLSADRSHLQ
jgi:hypothetical protein